MLGKFMPLTRTVELLFSGLYFTTLPLKGDGKLGCGAAHILTRYRVPFLPVTQPVTCVRCAAGSCVAVPSWKRNRRPDRSATKSPCSAGATHVGTASVGNVAGL